MAAGRLDEEGSMRAPDVPDVLDELIALKRRREDERKAQRLEQIRREVAPP